MILIIEIIITVTSALYVLIVTWLIAGWLKLSCFKTSDKNQHNNFSIIVPARNEADNIINCLDALLNQKYPQTNFEVIVVNDHSSDNTQNIVDSFIKNSKAGNLRLISLSGNLCGKKAALNAGIESAGFDFILTTDADCKMEKSWLQIINDFVNKKQPEMIIMPVTLKQEKSFFQKLQSLEFLSTAGTTAATAGWDRYIMCNGANLGFKKESFIKVGRYHGNTNYASGDDVFLLHKMKKAFPGKIFYLKNKGVIIKTKPSESLKEFMNQRKRWVSKSKAYKDKLTHFIAYTVGVFNIVLVLSLLLPAISGSNIWLWAWGVKIVIDFPFLMMASRFFGKQKLLLFYPATAVIYPFYVVFTLISSLRGGFTWKERSY